VGRRALCELLPGATADDTLELGRMFELKMPGLYTVVATRHVFSRDKPGQFVAVTSNSLALRIVP
jgi:hypothetical protein